MAWQTPKTDWGAADGVRNTDFNRIEGNIGFLHDASGVIYKYQPLVAAPAVGNTINSTVNPIPTTWNAETVGTIYTNGDYRIEADSVNTQGSAYAFRAFDNNETTNWASNNASGGWISVKLPVPTLVRKIRTKFSLLGSNAVLKIQGSNDNATWIDLYSVTAPSNPTSLTEITLTTTGTYRYYRILTSDTSLTSVFEFRLSDYSITTYSVAYTLAALTSAPELGQIVNVWTPVLSVAGINVNTINGYSVDAILKSNTRYELVYNGTSFNAKEAS